MPTVTTEAEARDGAMAQAAANAIDEKIILEFFKIAPWFWIDAQRNLPTGYTKQITGQYSSSHIRVLITV
ncbi:MAG: hypothetical protein V4631_10230 [Pseudomonadota bacterium]